MDTFNNREVASAIWMLIILAYALSKKPIRESLFNVIKAFCHWKILMPSLLMVVYTSGIILILQKIGFWKISLLKDSILWVCFTGLVMLMNSVTSKEENYFRKMMIDNLKVALIIEFLVNTYTFSLVGELLFLPFVTLIVMLQTIAKTDQKYLQVEKLLNWVNGFIGILVLVFVVDKLILNYSSFASLDTLRQFLLAPILSFSFIPFIYIAVVLATYELVFLRLEFGSKKSKKLKNYAKIKIISYCLINLKRIKTVLAHHIVDVLNLETKDDVDNMMKYLKN